MAKGAAESKKGTAADETQEVKMKKCRPTKSIKKLCWYKYLSRLEGDMSPATTGRLANAVSESLRSGRSGIENTEGLG